MSDRILVSTHDLQRAGALREGFREAGYGVEFVTPQEELGSRDDAVLLVLTVPGPGETGQHLLGEAERLEIPVVGFGPGGLDGLAEVFPQGATADEVVLVSRRLLERRRLQEITGIVGESDAVREILERVVQFAPVASTVLITGESGTGKELVARGIHALSPRKHKSFIAVNVAALPDTLLESELFGHEKGAFTGAIDSRRGLFELADGGTIFLDEIGEMPLATQTKLLRVLEQREFLRVGGEKPISVNVRIVAATNQDLRQLVTLREFRKDLYYRLNVLRIEVPPLRERADDIPLLAHRFTREVAHRLGRTFEGISDEAMELLKEHRWPGNVRELRNLVESMVVLAPGREIRAQDIPDEIRRGGAARELLPAPIPRGESRGDTGEAMRPQLEFVFRTLVEMRMDVDQLRREFEAYRERDPAVEGGDVAYLPRRRDAARPSPAELEGVEIVDVAPSDATGGRWQAPGDDIAPGAGEGGGGSEPEGPEEAPPGEEGVVVFRPGMTMDDLEREAITAALDRMDGNRRKAAEMLGIGERTLYRKIKKYDLEG